MVLTSISEKDPVSALPVVSLEGHLAASQAVHLAASQEVHLAASREVHREASQNRHLLPVQGLVQEETNLFSVTDQDFSDQSVLTLVIKTTAVHQAVKMDSLGRPAAAIVLDLQIDSVGLIDLEVLTELEAVRTDLGAAVPTDLEAVQIDSEAAVRTDLPVTRTVLIAVPRIDLEPVVDQEAAQIEAVDQEAAQTEAVDQEAAQIEAVEVQHLQTFSTDSAVTLSVQAPAAPLIDLVEDLAAQETRLAQAEELHLLEVVASVALAQVLILVVVHSGLLVGLALVTEEPLALGQDEALVGLVLLAALEL